jgi:predicted AAA+ superfamily ATPase
MYLPRTIEKSVKEALENFPVTAIIGPRQCGKSTLVKHIIDEMRSLSGVETPEVLYLDLERPSDLQKLENAEWFL